MNYVKIKDLSKPQKGIYGIGASATRYSDDLPQYLRITDIDDFGNAPAVLPTCININIYNDWENYLLRKNDIVFARTGNSTGRNYFCKSISRDTVFAGFLIKFTIDSELVIPQYVGYYCQSPAYWNSVKLLFTGSTRANINAEQYGDLLIPIINKDIQQHIVNTIGSIDDLIEKNEQFLSKFQSYLVQSYRKYSLECDNTIEIKALIDRTGKSIKDSQWKESKVLDLSTMPNGNIFINDFSDGKNFSTNIKSVNNFDIVYGSIRPYFKKAGFALDVNYIAGTVFSFNVKNANDYLWVLACISSDNFHSFTSINAQGTKMPIINWKTFTSYKIRYDSQIVITFQKIIKPIFEICIIKMRQNRKLKVIKEYLLKKYF